MIHFEKLVEARVNFYSNLLNNPYLKHPSAFLIRAAVSTVVGWENGGMEMFQEKVHQ